MFAFLLLVELVSEAYSDDEQLLDLGLLVASIYLEELFICISFFIMLLTKMPVVLSREAKDSIF